MPSLLVFGGQLSVTWSTPLVFAGLTYKSESLPAVAGCPVALAAAVQLCPASVTFLLGPAGKDRIDLLVAMDDRGTRGQTLIHRP